MNDLLAHHRGRPSLETAPYGTGGTPEAARACLTAGLAQLSAERIIAVVDEANASSLRVVERIGISRIDRISAHGRPHFLYAAE